MKARILGCGTSWGVPRIGGEWGDCDPAEPRNRRLRQSILVEGGGVRVLVDSSPDLRQQLLAAEASQIDAVIWTHDHADHCNGIDDLRQIARLNGPIAGYAAAATAEVLRQRFDYVFAGAHGYPPVAILTEVGDVLQLGGLTIRSVLQPHGRISSLGLRFEEAGASLVYATDFYPLTPDMAALYAGADAWIVDALRREWHPTHPRLSDVVRWTEELRIGRAALIHMDNSMDYRTLVEELPDHIHPGFDGMEITLP